MIIAKNDEAKRSKIWRIVTLVSSLLIVIIGIYFLTKMFTANPLEGTWADEDGNYTIAIKGGSSLSTTIPNIAEVENVVVKMDFAMNKEEKTITIKQNATEIKKSSKRYDVSTEAVENALSPITTTFSYSVDRKVLTLTEREYGEQIMLNKK